MSDYTALIQSRKEYQEAQRTREAESALLLQRIYRGYTARVEMFKIREERRKYDQKRFEAARAIQRRIRGIIGRRIVLVRLSLMVIEVRSSRRD